MSKNIRRILIAAAALVVLILAFVLLKYVFPEKEVLPEPTPVPTEAPTYYLIHRSASEVCGITFDYGEGSVLTVDMETGEDGEYVFTVSPEDEFFGYSTSRFRSIMYTVSSILATSRIEENPKDLSDYGLDSPWFTLTVRFTDGSSTRIYLGNETPVQNYYYAITDQENTVYTIGGYLTGLVTRQSYAYRNIDSFPSYKDNDIYTCITHFRLTRRDGVNIEIYLDENYSMEGNISSSSYMMTQPLVSPCTSETVEGLLDVLATITMDSVLGDITASELAEYGLDKPARLLLEDIVGNQLELVIGTAGDSQCIAAIARQYDALMAGEIEKLTLLSYTETNFDWLDLNYMSLQIRTPWIINIHDVESVTYDLDGDIYEMVLYEYDDVTGSGLDVVRTCSHINGKDINETNTKRIYSRTLNFRQVSAIPENAVYEEGFTNSITIRLKDGTERVMTFHKMNERQYACSLDGRVEYYIYSSNLSSLHNALERAMDDREVPMVYSR